MDKFVKHTRLYRIMIGVAAFGALVSAYATYLHFSPTPSTICNLNASFDCDAVNKGLYSEIFGIPVSVLGFIGYMWMILLLTQLLRQRDRQLRLLFAGTIAFAVGFQAHLAWISSELLQTWCIICIGSYVTTVLLLGLFIADEIW